MATVMGTLGTAILLSLAQVDSVYTSLAQANLCVGVGDGTTTGAQSDLTGTNKYRKLCTSLSRSGNVWTIVVDVDSSHGVWTWNEIAIFNAVSGTTAPNGMLVRDLPASPYAHGAVAVTMTITFTLA